MHEDGDSDITGTEKIYQVVEEEDDISFIKQYLTQEIVDDLEMFSYIRNYDSARREYIEIESKNVDDVAEYIVNDLYNYRSPLIYIAKASGDGVELVHEYSDEKYLDQKHLNNVLKYIHEIWGGIINIETIDNNGEVVNFSYDELGFSHDEDSDKTSPLFTGV